MNSSDNSADNSSSPVASPLTTEQRRPQAPACTYKVAPRVHLCESPSAQDGLCKNHLKTGKVHTTGKPHTTDEVGSCIFTLTAGHRKGELCGEPTLLDDLCESHVKLTEPNTEHNTCSHKFVSGPRVGFFCALPQVKDGLCVKHVILTEPSASHCSYRRVKGAHPGSYCNEEPVKNGQCWTHYAALNGLKAPVTGVDATCKHMYMTGRLAGLYCVRRGIPDHDAYMMCSQHSGKAKNPALLDEPAGEGYCTTEISTGKFCPRRTAFFNTDFCKNCLADKFEGLSCDYVFIAGGKKGNSCGSTVVRADNPPRCKKHVGMPSAEENKAYVEAFLKKKADKLKRKEKREANAAKKAAKGKGATLKPLSKPKKAVYFEEEAEPKTLKPQPAKPQKPVRTDDFTEDTESDEEREVEKEVEKKVSGSKKRCTALVLVVSHKCQRKTYFGEFCSVHRKVTGDEDTERKTHATRCKGEVTKYSRCKRNAKKGNKCGQHISSPVELSSDEE